jgi:hypothetical protein
MRSSDPASGLIDTFAALYPQWQSIDFRRTAERLHVPVYLFTGRHELAARRDLAVEWFHRLETLPHLQRSIE